MGLSKAILALDKFLCRWSQSNLNRMLISTRPFSRTSMNQQIIQHPLQCSNHLKYKDKEAGISTTRVRHRCCHKICFNSRLIIIQSKQRINHLTSSLCNLDKWPRMRVVYELRESSKCLTTAKKTVEIARMIFCNGAVII